MLSSCYAATQQYDAHQLHGLMPLLAEIYADAAAGSSYSAVAVVSKSMCDANPNMTLSSLAGKRSCHTGYQRTAGWSVPIGFLTQTGVVSYSLLPLSMSARAVALQCI